VYEPGTTVPPEIVNVALPVGVTLAVFSEQVAPDGHPDTLRVTDLLYPLSAVRVIVLDPLPPVAMLTDVGFADIEKSGFGWTVSPTVVACVNVPSVPCTVNVYDPVAAVPVEMLNAELPAGVTAAGVSEHVAPDGHPETVRLTVLL
jgi:hypothetical protein